MNEEYEFLNKEYEYLRDLSNRYKEDRAGIADEYRQRSANDIKAYGLVLLLASFGSGIIGYTAESALIGITLFIAVSLVLLGSYLIESIVEIRRDQELSLAYVEDIQDHLKALRYSDVSIHEKIDYIRDLQKYGYREIIDSEVGPE